jgi:O-methyltransferase involved in polyketide biosynthesis
VMDEAAGRPRPPVVPGVDSTVAHAARIWDHWLGGTANFAADRAAGDAWLAVDPGMAAVARESRAFLRRTVRFLAAEAGVRQFLDIGSGLPTAQSTHQVAQAVAPESVVVYVDHDPLVQAHAEVLLTGARATHFLDADVQDPSGLVKRVVEILDPGRPAAVLLLGVLGHLEDLDEARDLVRYVVDRTCPGSYLVVADAGRVHSPAAMAQAQRVYRETGASPYTFREPAEIESFFEGLDWVEPGFVPIIRWRPDGPAPPRPIEAYGGVGRRR